MKSSSNAGTSTNLSYEPVITADAPSFFSISFSGRLGRLRFIVYSMMTALVFVGLIGLSALLFKSTPLIVMATILVLYVIMIYRPIVLRMHDFNLSGKWLLLLFLIIGVTSVSNSAGLMMGMSFFYVVFWGALLLMPGSSDINDFGSPCPPNTTFISVTAWLLIGLTLFGGVASYKVIRNQGSLLATPKLSAAKSGYGFTSANNSFTINFPVMPKDEAEKVAKAKGPGIEDAHIYHVASDGFEYFAQEIVFMQIPPNKNAATTELSNIFLSRLGGEILSSQKTMQGEYTAEAAKVRLPTGAYQDFRFFFVGKRFYVLGVQRPKERENSPDVDNFFDSFQAH